MRRRNVKSSVDSSACGRVAERKGFQEKEEEWWGVEGRGEERRDSVVDYDECGRRSRLWSLEMYVSLSQTVSSFKARNLGCLLRLERGNDKSCVKLLL